MENAETAVNQVVGYLDQLSETLEIRGWAWWPEEPARRLEIEIVINGEPVGTIVADGYRRDVEAVGHGDGRYGFAWAVPLDALQPTPEIVISARELGSGAPLVNVLSFPAVELAERLEVIAAGTDAPEAKRAALRAAVRLAPEVPWHAMAPDEPWHAMALAEVLREARQPEEAEAVLKALLASHPEFWHAFVALGHISRNGGARTEALEWFRRAIELAPGEMWCWLDVAEELRVLGRAEDAKAVLLRAAEHFPDSWAVEMGLGHCARAQAEQGEARRHFEKAARLAPDEVSPRLGLIEVLRDAGALEEARQAALGLLAAHPGHMPLLLSLAYIERLIGLDEAAAAHFTEALALEPENPTLLAELARQEYQLGRQQEGNAHLSWALKLDPGHLDAVCQLAGQALAVGDAAQAFKIFQAAAARRPAEQTFRYGMLDALAWQGRAEEALAGLQALEQEHGTTSQLQNWRITLLRRVGRMDEALHAARAATATAPQEFWLWTERFQTELLAGSDAMVQKCLFGIPATSRIERAIRRRCVGALAESLWQMDAALAHYEEAAALNPKDILLQEALARVKLMRFDLSGARGHLRRQYELMAAERRLRGESLNISQSLLGQMIDEYAVDEELHATLAGVSARSTEERLETLVALTRQRPDSTAAAASLLLAVREADRTGFVPVQEPPPIPRIINTFWHRPAPPEDVGVLIKSWQDRNPGYRLRRFDEEQARNYLAAKFPSPVTQAYQRVQEVTQKADIFRLALLVEEGGVYADADDRCLGSLDMLLPVGASLVLAQEQFGCAANHFIAASPGHPVLLAALRAVVTAVNRGDNEIPWLLSGPGLLTRALAQHVAAHGIGGLPPGLAFLDRRQLGAVVAGGCFAAYKTYHMRHRRRIDAAAAYKPG
ncbi:MAG: tetratricopeptide repeat protein [Rhodospirillales bacterium]|nr:tetratricopeptide repeat protein [Rhodospirillales bacterium]